MEPHSLKDVLELERSVFKSYDSLFKKLIRELVKIESSVKKIEIYEDSSSFDCPTTHLYYNDGEEIFLSDLEHSENQELVRLAKELEELLCLWLKRYPDYFNGKQLIMKDPIPVEIIIY